MVNLFLYGHVVILFHGNGFVFFFLLCHVYGWVMRVHDTVGKCPLLQKLEVAGLVILRIRLRRIKVWLVIRGLAVHLSYTSKRK